MEHIPGISSKFVNNGLFWPTLYNGLSCTFKINIFSKRHEFSNSITIFHESEIYSKEMGQNNPFGYYKRHNYNENDCVVKQVRIRIVALII